MWKRPRTNSIEIYFSVFNNLISVCLCTMKLAKNIFMPKNINCIITILDGDCSTKASDIKKKNA